VRLLADEGVDRANAAGRILITVDKDFGELVFRLRRVVSGVLLVRLAGLTPAQKSDFVAAAIREHADEMQGAFTVVSAGRVRIRPQL